MTKIEFEESYARRSGFKSFKDMENKIGLYKAIALPCDCEELDCLGWKMMFNKDKKNG